MVKACVLIVEDNPDVQGLLRTLLEIKGFSVVTADDGVAALKLLAGSLPDIIITDLMMPRLDGIELIHRVRTTAAFRHLPIIAMSAYGSGSMSAAKAIGANATIRKPTGFDRLAELIRELLSNQLG